VNNPKTEHPIKVKIVSTFKPDGILGLPWSSRTKTSGVVSGVMIIDFLQNKKNELQIKTKSNEV
jgi:hypothetical protein